MLHLLLGRPMYGYELVQAIKTATDQEFGFGEGCVYPILHRLEADGLLKASRETAAGRSRVVYRVTPKGKKHLAETLTCCTVTTCRPPFLIRSSVSNPRW